MQNEEQKEILENEVKFLSKKILDLNKKLIESKKAETLFLSLIANNFNNPMTAILGMLPHLKIQDDAKNEKIFATIRQEALSLDFKIQNLITVAEIESGNSQNSYSLTDIQKIVNEIIQDLRYVIDEKKSKIEINNLLKSRIIIDSKKVYTILKNLIANGCMYAPDDATLFVELSIENSALKILVKNRGTLPKVNSKPEVFTRFSQKIDNSHGLGVGLSIVRELCENLCGSVDYDAENNFVTFKVLLPLNKTVQDSEACGWDEFLFESFDNAIEI
ncbi:MAG: HAMP domain-containing sensor histidine kinase [Sulfurimonas sp.]|uniref:sensor histidine kinase n=1 Tax=Sulfurimonas sp. TaxID=2022749 RepID=UPI00260B532B|nr:HAMP domain-containing sensor histidine kinase [Sulfurimonas sp.]MDD2652545.1 HAMP domain-containing sensor histidine kinase [Sulfurimonas sp.]MDD3451280.1 HAMP domain-containing sensor histidine kinase [Sulfurimonas sp.]